MRNGLLVLPAAALVSAVLTGPINAVWAQNPGSSMPSGAPKSTTTQQLTNQSFVTQAAQSNLAELKFSQLAAERSQNDQIRQFAEQMLSDHGKAGNELKQIASGQGIPLPTELSPKHQTALTALGKQQGQAFDTAYAKQMQQDHDVAVALFEQAAETETLDASLRGFARKTLPTLKAHQQLARKLNTANASYRPMSAAATESRRVHHVW